MTAEYLDFELEIGLGQGRDYPVAVLRSPAGEARATMRFPFDEFALERHLDKLQIALLHSGGKRRQALTQEQQDVQDFGQLMFDALMTGDIRSLYDVSQKEAGDKGLRLKLRIADPKLAVLPWEFLYDSRQAEYICLSRHTPIVRYLQLPQPPGVLAIEPPLRILGMIASPSDTVTLDVESERQRVEQALAGLSAKGLVELEWLAGQTWRDLQKAMRGGPWHIFHFVGHGAFDANADEGLVLFCDDQGKAHRFRATDLGRMLADHRTLRLVFLNACEGARGSERDIFSSTASILVRNRIPAVLAMQYEITDRAAVELSRAFYESLVEGLPVDAAVAEARKAVSWAVTNTVEWGTPVLYMRAPDGKLFDLVHTAYPAKPLPQPLEPPVAVHSAPAPAILSRLEPATASGVQVFISHAHEDAAQAQELYQRLVSVGLQPWMESADLLPGEQWRESILRAVRQSHFFLACLSTHAVDKRGSLQRELKLAADSWQEKLADDIYLIPVRLDECELPEALKAFQWVNLYEPDGWTKLLRGLRAGIERQGMSAPDELLAELSQPAVKRKPQREPVSTPTRNLVANDVLSITEPLRMEFVRVPAGEFLMGSDPVTDKGAYDVEQPQHVVRLDEYYIGKYPVTNAQYEAFVEATKAEPPKHWSRNLVPRGEEEHPVVNVSWRDAMAFCDWLRTTTGEPFWLPSEAEWEKAASWDAVRGEKRAWPWGNVFEADKCNSQEGSKGRTTQVGQYPDGASPCGALDMSGNVWEWTSSCFKDYWYDPHDGREDRYVSGARVLRGGSSYNDARFVRCAYREYNDPSPRFYLHGFRVCVSSGLSTPLQSGTS